MFCLQLYKTLHTLHCHAGEFNSLNCCHFTTTDIASFEEFKMDPVSSCRDYEFPFEPYGIQLQLMNQIYESIDKGKVAIIESPTGTGKSLSIICSVLKWIEDNKSNQIRNMSKDIEKLQISCNANTADDWVLQQSKQIAAKHEIQSLEKTLGIINNHVNYSQELKKKAKFRKHYQVAEMKNSSINKRPSDNLFDLPDEENELIVKYCESDDLESVDEEKKQEKYFTPKIYYCSRTHSQLSQFINEIKKTKKCQANDHSLMMVPLSSRANYCINSNVNRFGNVNLINEKCSELQSGTQKCCMHKQTNMHQLNEDILATVQDLEDVVSKAKQLKACPYYASRLSIAEAEIVILPYNILLHKGTRTSFGVHLKNSVVIVDEAHNLLETLANVYSIEIQHRHLDILHRLLSKYLARYYTRFNSLNIMYLKQLIFILKRMMLLLTQSKTAIHSFFPLEFVLKLEIEHINIYKLVEFLDKSHIASKLHMFSLKPQSCEEVKKPKITGTMTYLNKFKRTSTLETEVSKPVDVNQSKEPDHTFLEEPFNSSMLYKLKELLLALKDYSVDGKVLLNIDLANVGDSTCKYILLNSSSHFKVYLLSRTVFTCKARTLHSFLY